MIITKNFSIIDITLSKEDLKGKYIDSEDCPIARAVKRRLKDSNLSYHKISVTPGLVQIWFTHDEIMYLTYDEIIDDDILSYKRMGSILRLFFKKINIKLR